jgi:hypothetical protein
MNADRPTEERWVEAVGDAAKHVTARDEAMAEAARRQRPQLHSPRLLVAAVVLIGVLCADIWLWTRDQPTEAAAQEREQLAWLVVDAVDAIEDFRAEEGRLPDADESFADLGEDVRYERTATGFAVTVEGDGPPLTFDGTLPIERWVAVFGTPLPYESEGER